MMMHLYNDKEMFNEHYDDSSSDDNQLEGGEDSMMEPKKPRKTLNYSGMKIDWLTRVKIYIYNVFGCIKCNKHLNKTNQRIIEGLSNLSKDFDLKNLIIQTRKVTEFRIDYQRDPPITQDEMLFIYKEIQKVNSLPSRAPIQIIPLAKEPGATDNSTFANTSNLNDGGYGSKTPIQIRVPSAPA